MRFKLFGCHHLRPENPVNTELFSAVAAGISREQGDPFISDLSGENISQKGDYCEMRQQYFVWKNLLGAYDFVGFEHYSRFFFLDPLQDEYVKTKYPRVWIKRQEVYTNRAHWGRPISLEGREEYLRMRSEFNASAIVNLKAWANSYDFIVTVPHQENIRVTWEKHHPPQLWHSLTKAYKESEYFRGRSCHSNDDIVSNYYLNMYIMRSEYFDEYMRLWSDVLSRLEAGTPTPHKARIWGHVSERLFSMYLYQKRLENPLLRVAELTYLRPSPKAADELLGSPG